MDDLIRRSDAITAYCEHECGKGMTREKCGAVDCGTIFDNIPSAQQWIPCSEQLPKTDNWRTTFNVTTETGIVVSMEWENTTVRGKDVSRWIWQDRISPWRVVAWSPLPEPYKESEKV